MQIPNSIQTAISYSPPPAAELIQQDNQAQPTVAPTTTADSAQTQDFGGARQEAEPALYTRQGLATSDPVSNEAVNEASSNEVGTGKTAETDASEKNGATSETDEQAAAQPSTKNVAGKELTAEQQEELLQLQSRDQEVRVHEQQHASVGGQHTGSPSYEYETGPDGKQYVVEGSVSVNLSPVAGDPAATIDKMRQVKAAALAPAQPSSADKNAAAAAEALIAQATAELMQANQPSTEDEESTENSVGDAPNSASSGAAPSNTAPSTTANSGIDTAATKSAAKIATDTPTPKDANGQMELRNQVIAGVYGQTAQKQSQQLLSLA